MFCLRSIFLSFMLMRNILSVLNVDVALLFGLKKAEITKHVAIRNFFICTV